MMKLVIIEDEKPAARRLARMVESMGLTVEKMLHSVGESVKWLLENDHPDLILLDIQLSDGLSFEIFEEVKVKSAIIFTTAYDEYALKAFKLNSIDYLLKPIDEDELKVAMDKFRENFKPADPQVLDLDHIRKMLVRSTENSFKKRYVLKIGQHLKMIPVEEIVCFFSENKGTYIRTHDQRDLLLEQTLDQVEEEVDPGKFFRINRKYIVSIDAIRDIIAYTNSRLRLKLVDFAEDDVIVSREKVKDFKDWLD